MKFIVMLEGLIKLAQHGESVAAVHAIGVIALEGLHEGFLARDGQPGHKLPAQKWGSSSSRSPFEVQSKWLEKEGAFGISIRRHGDLPDPGRQPEKPAKLMSYWSAKISSPRKPTVEAPLDPNGANASVR